MARIRISKEYKGLYRVPKNAIIDFLIDKDENSVRNAIRELDSSASGALLSLLVKLDYKQVIYVFQKCTETTPEEALELYRQYRYRGMKTLYLYTCEDLNGLNNLNKTALNRTLATNTEEFNSDSSRRFSDLKIREIEPIDDNRTIIEFSYSYNGFIPYIPPKTGYPDTIADLRRGFVWTHSADSWLCICAKDANVAYVLHNSLKDYLGFTSKPLPLTKTVQQQVENMEDIRRAGYINPAGTRRRITNPHMVNDSDAMDECRQRNSSEDRPLASFNINLPDGKLFTLSYNENGTIHFSKDLTVDQMRQWGVEKIKQIIEVVNELRINEPSELLSEHLNALSGVSKKAKPAILEIASAIIRCKTETVADVALETNIFGLAENLKRYVQPIFRVYCPQCDDNTEIVCSCDSRDFVIQGDHVQCGSCSSLIQRRVQCLEGHNIAVNLISDCIELLSLSRLNDVVKKIMKEAADIIFNSSEESFSIRSNRLYYRTGLTKTIYKLQEIPDYQSLLHDVPTGEDSNIRKAFVRFKERCPQMSNDNCSQCITNDVSNKCYLRLFGLFDPNYGPRPHQGHEFGDYSAYVNLDGTQQTLVVAMKSDKKKTKVTLRDSVGRDLYSQVGGYFHDGRIDVVGVCLPRKLEEGFEAMLVRDARDKNKKLVVIDDDDLVQIAYSVMQNRNMQLDKI